MTALTWNLLDLDGALRASWAADTCSPDDRTERVGARLGRLPEPV
ncbi:hypothetical protein ACIRSU_08235 [Streptomyces sp. NPDC101160]